MLCGQGEGLNREHFVKRHEGDVRQIEKVHGKVLRLGWMVTGAADGARDFYEQQVGHKDGKGTVSQYFKHFSARIVALLASIKRIYPNAGIDRIHSITVASRGQPRSVFPTPLYRSP